MTVGNPEIRCNVLAVACDGEDLDAALDHLVDLGHEVTSSASLRLASEEGPARYDLILLGPLALDEDREVIVAGLAKQAAADLVLFAEQGAGRPRVELFSGRFFSLLARPFDLAMLDRLIRRVVDRVEMEQKAAHLRQHLETTQLDWATTVDAIQDPIAVVDAEGFVLRANRSFARRFGRSASEVVGARDTDLLFAGDPDAFHASRVGYLTYETNELAVPGTFLVSHYPIQLDRGPCVVYHLTDTSARKEAEEALRRSEAQLRQAQKMEAIGRLAGGVAHDFNNLLTTVIGHAELLLMQLQSGGDDYEAVTQINQAAQRGAGLTRQLLSFSRARVIRPEVIDLNAVIADMGKLLPPLLGEDIELKFVQAPDLMLVHRDRGQLDQVLMNLAVNARDAMPGGGTLTLETANATHVLELSDGGRSEPCVVLSLSDTGEGMDENTQLRAFEPFFTTKPEGKGTGLGLSMVYAIVKQHRGDLEIQSSVGEGTTMTIFLPAVDQQVTRETKAKPVATRNPRGTETILLVEDDESVRKVVRGMLESMGYRVVAVAGAAEALHAAREMEGKLDLLLTDFVMPNMNGGELAQQIRREFPAVKVLMMSGYAPSSQRYQEAVRDGIPFIAKPFRPLTLAEKLRAIFDGQDPS